MKRKEQREERKRKEQKEKERKKERHGNRFYSSTPL
jgi:hypothetical protein